MCLTVTLGGLVWATACYLPWVRRYRPVSRVVIACCLQAQQVSQRDAPPVGGFEVQFLIKVRWLRLASASGAPLTVTLGTMKEAVNIRLSNDEALVLFELLSRFQETNELRLKNNAEFVALSSLSAQLDKTLVEPFQANYLELLHGAQARVADGFEGLAPGVAN